VTSCAWWGETGDRRAGHRIAAGRAKDKAGAGAKPMADWAADLVVLIHFLYIVFLIAGPVLFLFLRWPRLRTIHLAAVGLALILRGFSWA